MSLLQRYAWPGNLRELRNVLERARLFADNGEIRSEHLPRELLHEKIPDASAPNAAPMRMQSRGLSDQQLIDYVNQAGNLSRRELATELGMSERTLYRRLKSLKLMP